ncbi:MAG: bifunctional isocitrate dehydrogenase kinase/phosphatase [Nannocystaceae bacterium]
MSHEPGAAIARLVHAGFDSFYAEFHRITREARRWFDVRDWSRVDDLHHERIDLYQRYVVRTLASLRPLTRIHAEDVAVWREAHSRYAQLIRERVDREVAQTFFNAITRKTFRTVGVNAEIEFLDRDLDTAHDDPVPGQIRRVVADEPDALFGLVLQQVRPALQWCDAERDARWLRAEHARHCAEHGRSPHIVAIEVLKPLFFRAREGYVVARIHGPDGTCPLLVPVQPTGAGMVVDGALFTVDAALQVFSSTRAYFFVDVVKPADVVAFLATLMPSLTESELYIAIAHHRHGKTLIHRELVEHLRASDDCFVMAPGIAGLVMTVFTLPSYRNVFKIIRDRFDKPTATREGILRCYREVFRGRRVGRLADTQEFEYLAFERRRFAPECLAELRAKAGNSVRIEGEQVVVTHLYIEEKMTPLNLYLMQVGLDQAIAAIIDYGAAIKELAGHNVFAGDLLWKNFGVTHHGRLVLYDYDEICPLLDCNFRAIPAPRSWEDEMSDQPYYAVADADVFPAEGAPFLVPREPAALREAFLAHHADLFTPEFWRERQRQVVAGAVHLGLPYPSRFPGLQ